MSGERIGIILIRLGAIFLVAQSLRALGWIPFSLFRDGEIIWESLAALLPIVGIPVIIAVFLWRLPSAILGGLPPAEEPIDRLDYDQLMVVGVSLIGLYVLVLGILELVGAFSSHVMTADYASHSGIREQIIHRYLMGAVQTVFGFVLVLGSAGIAKLIFKARRAGTGSG